MKKPLHIKKLALLNIPYVFIALFATKLGQAWRLAPGTDFSGKALHLMEGFAAAADKHGYATVSYTHLTLPTN